jgi:hypothetical protein
MTELLPVIVSTKRVTPVVKCVSVLLGIAFGATVAAQTWKNDDHWSICLCAGLGCFAVGYLCVVLSLQTGKRQTILVPNPDALFNILIEMAQK